MHLQALEFSHKSARLALREHLARRADALADLVGPTAAEWLILKTCGRLELYLVSPAGCHVDEFLHRAACALACTVSDLRAGLRHHTGLDAAQHLLRVAAGLESPIPGEDQIQAQVRCAFLTAQELRTIGPLLSALFRAAIHTGRRVRRETNLGRAVRGYTQRAIAALATHCLDHTIIFGTGTLARELIHALARRGTPPLAIVSHHEHRAADLAAQYDSFAATPADLPALLETADALITCTTASNPVVTRKHLPHSSRPLRIIDLGLPRNVAPDVATRPNIHVLSLPDLLGDGALTDETRVAAETVIGDELHRYHRWLAARRVAPVVRILHAASRHAPAHGPVRQTLHRAIRRLQESAA